MILPRTAKAAERMVFSNSRTLPGQGRSNSCFAAVALKDFAGSLANFRKCSAKRRISEPRSRSGGKGIAKKVQSKKQILAKAALLYLLGQILMRRGHNSNVDLLGRLAANR